MMTKKLFFPALLGLLLFLSLPAQAQPNEEIRINLNEEGTRYFRFTFLNQVWLRYNKSNPGTLVFGEPESSTFDIGLRRTRIQMYGQITKRAFLYFQFGQNNFNFTRQKELGAFFHDAVCEYAVLPENRLKIGAGLTILSGLSRYSQPSIGTILTADVPVFAQATTGVIDQFTRRLGVYARGQIGNVDYRFIVADPFAPNAVSLQDNADFASQKHHKNYQSYVFYQFLEKEGHTTPYITGTYLGSKRIFNIGGGFMYQKEAMWSLEASDTLFHNLFLLAFDAYLDIPLDKEKGTALSAYAAFFSNDYGPDYIRNAGVMNPGTGVNANASFAGAGNAFPMMGTGNALYVQAGYLFPRDLFGEEWGTVQPYATLLSARYEALDDAMNVYSLGVNYLMKGHTSKLSFDVQSRPVFDLNAERTGRREMYVLQYQISI